MSAKHGLTTAVLLVLLAGPLARAQMPDTLPFTKVELGPEKMPQAPTPPTITTTTTTTGAPVLPYAAESWIYQQQPNGAGCCGPIGGHGPIGSEAYIRGGASLVVSGGAFSKSLRTGWEVMGGGRSLFFNPDGNRAFVVDVGVSFTQNDGKPTNTFNFGNTAVTLRGLNRTAASLGLGMDWFASGPGFVGGNWDTNFRFGFDGGARWGTTHLDMNIVGTTNGYLRKQDVYGAAFAAIHLDVDVPMGAWTLL
ncbi:MAG: hypothetical protein K8T89_16515, partial [Planctomycetes bacterium]|nr:hypothetical protein [Planctomycetota bacterium]